MQGRSVGVSRAQHRCESAKYSYTHTTLKPIRRTDPRFHLAILRYRSGVRNSDRAYIPVFRNLHPLGFSLPANSSPEMFPLQRNLLRRESTGCSSSSFWPRIPHHGGIFSSNILSLKRSYLRRQPRGRLLGDCDQGRIERLEIRDPVLILQRTMGRREYLDMEFINDYSD